MKFDWSEEKYVYSEIKKSRLNALNRSNSWDCSSRVHLFLSYNLIYVPWGRPGLAFLHYCCCCCCFRPGVFWLYSSHLRSVIRFRETERKKVDTKRRKTKWRKTKRRKTKRRIQQNGENKTARTKRQNYKIAT